MTQSPEHDVIWLTQEAFDKLKDELENLRGPVRDEIVADLRVQRDDPTQPAHCLLRATAADFVQVGELDAPIPAGTERIERVQVPVRTIHRATTVEVISCRLG